ncbi:MULTISPECIES: molybdate ABC transporter substrate-binding protein [unclassified Dehalobacter]|uniref:molybdate ABC transporter substrate-binding protein n=1 Tax=unclassified Dehalobacter TaxID=2635733 RepID=UPI000E6D59C4|nr:MULTISPECIES: molybdate ABC transporter substrate-binding protein [unclassified Dehalobacter]RJE47556.1 molybdate ABC transporter substrate-binding protein [Dehalobacter sp. MCB1]TCX48633.1 molybdate ABC transporter substrate-binding protein [Dehalobacter sp. 14DCB1]TCX56318.1 molybdate ABC transporter substrate-binding protein [Dehalobacter sp. 12DCB1]
MKKMGGILVMLLVACLVLVGCSSSGSSANRTEQKETVSVEKKEILASAAASLKDVMTEIETQYETRNAGINLTINYGASGSLQQQIEQGAPTDVFISAGKKQMDALEKGNLLAEGTRMNLLGNDLVLITGKDNKSITSFQDLAKADKISIGTPESVPAGKYAQESLTRMKLWNTLQAQDKFVMAKDVTQVLTYVESGNVDAGIVYQSDAQGSDKVKVIAVAPADSHSAIVYPAAAIAGTKNLTEAKNFLNYLSSDDAQQIFVKYGFKIMK